MKERRYHAFLDNGENFIFYSEYRKGSKKNKEDAIKRMKNQYGYSEA